MPEGFEGLEEYKDEILAELGDAPQEESESTTSDYVPYQRFKEVIDEKNALKAQIDELKKQGAQSQPQQTPFRITNEFVKDEFFSKIIFGSQKLLLLNFWFAEIVVIEFLVRRNYNVNQFLVRNNYCVKIVERWRNNGSWTTKIK